MNSVILMGRLVRDVELKQTSTGKTYCRFSLAVKKEFTKDGADFINCVAWDKRAEILANYLSKGQRILIQGRLNTSSYEANGETRYSTDVIVDKITFIENMTGGSSIESPKVEDETTEDDEFPF